MGLQQLPAAARLFLGPFEPPSRAAVRARSETLRGWPSGSSRDRSGPRRLRARSCPTARGPTGRSSSAGRRAAAQGRRRRAHRSNPARTATSGRRSSGSRGPFASTGIAPTDWAPSTRIGTPERSRSSCTGSKRPLVQSTCERASRRVRGVTAARTASGIGVDHDDAGAARVHRPDQAEVLLTSHDDLVVRPEVETCEHDVAAVRRRARQRDVLRLDAHERCESRAYVGSQLQMAVEVRLPHSTAAPGRPAAVAAPTSNVGRASGPNVPALRYATRSRTGKSARASAGVIRS